MDARLQLQLFSSIFFSICRMAVQRFSKDLVDAEVLHQWAKIQRNTKYLMSRKVMNVFLSVFCLHHNRESILIIGWITWRHVWGELPSLQAWQDQIRSKSQGQTSPWTVAIENPRLCFSVFMKIGAVIKSRLRPSGEKNRTIVANLVPGILRRMQAFKKSFKFQLSFEHQTMRRGTAISHSVVGLQTSVCWQRTLPPFRGCFGWILGGMVHWFNVLQKRESCVMSKHVPSSTPPHPRLPNFV